MRLHANFRADRSNLCWDMADFRFFKMAVVRHLRIVLRVFGPTKWVFADLCYCAKFGWNRSSGFDNMPFLMFCKFGLKMPIYAPFWVVLGDLTFLMGHNINQSRRCMGHSGSSRALIMLVS